MIANGDYYMTRDEDGARCVWSSDMNVAYLNGYWDTTVKLLEGGTKLVFDDSSHRRQTKEWLKLIGRKCFGIRNGGSGWITVSEDPA